MSLPKGPTEMTLVSQNCSTNIKALMFTVAELLYIYIPIMNLLCIFFYMCSIKTEQTSLSKTLILRFFCFHNTPSSHRQLGVWVPAMGSPWRLRRDKSLRICPGERWIPPASKGTQNKFLKRVTQLGSIGCWGQLHGFQGYRKHAKVERRSTEIHVIAKKTSTFICCIPRPSLGINQLERKSNLSFGMGKAVLKLPLVAVSSPRMKGNAWKPYTQIYDYCRRTCYYIVTNIL